jgi:peptidoglycan hydrolase-like protein with peptidoglycan-binding domain
MINIRQGDKGPRVVLLQIALSLHDARAALKADGNFGPHTREAVKRFQAARKLQPTGEISGLEWHELEKILSFQTYDHIDTDEVAVKLMKNPKQGAKALMADGLNYSLASLLDLSLLADSTPHEMMGASNAIELLIRNVTSAGRQNGKLGLLRIFGHGAPGYQSIAVGRLRPSQDDADDPRSSLTATLTRRLRSKFMAMAPVFHPFASAELHGCRVASSASGLTLLKDLANAWKIPVTGAIERQRSGSGQAFRFEGPTITVYPDKLNLKQWAERAEGAAAVCR